MLKRCPMCIQTLLLIPTIPGHLTKGPQRWSIEVIANANYLVNSGNTLMRSKFGKLKLPFSTSLVFNPHSACCSYLKYSFCWIQQRGDLHPWTYRPWQPMNSCMSLFLWALSDEPILCFILLLLWQVLFSIDLNIKGPSSETWPFNSDSESECWIDRESCIYMHSIAAGLT
jgi:hypothetical protein